MTDTLKLHDFLPYRLSTLSNRVSQAIAGSYAQRFDLTMPEWRVMAVLGETPDISATDVAERTAMDKVAVSRAVSRLLDARRLERHVSADDKRRSVLALSAEGLRIYDQVVPLALAYEERMIAELTPSERLLLRQLLDKLDGLTLDMLLDEARLATAS